MAILEADRKRRARFVAYVLANSKYGPDVLKRGTEARRRLRLKLGVTTGRMNHLFNENQPFGQRAAAERALAFGLPQDYFEQDRPETAQRESTTYSPTQGSAHKGGETEESEKRLAQTDRLLFLWEPLFDVQRERILQNLVRENAQARETIDEMKRRGWINPSVPENVLPQQFTRPAQREFPMDDESIARPHPKEPKK